MTIRMRLLLSYAAMLVIPLVLMMLTAIVLIVAFRGDLQSIRDQYGSRVAGFEDWHDERYLKEIKRNGERSPGLLEQPDYLNELSQGLVDSGASLVVRKDSRLIYQTDAIKQSPVVESLAPFDRPGHVERTSAKRYGSSLFVVTQMDFSFQDGVPGSVFVIRPINPIVNFAQKFLPILLVSFLVILVLTHTLLTYFVSKSIIRPLSVLRKAAKQIKQGELDFQVGVSGKDEIGQLGIAFEEMRIQLQESIRVQLQYEENRKELISNISHDLKTPLTAIQGYVDGILDGVADTPEKNRKYMRTIAVKTQELDRLIEELFLYSKLDLNKLPFNFERVDIGAYLQDWAEELHFDMEKKGIRFTASIDVTPGTVVSVDRDKLKRTISNIMENCVKYMDKPEKTIRFQAEGTPEAIVFAVTDNGRGIEPEALPHIFERFYRAEQSRNANTGGSGLGLAIAKQIVEGHGGEIRTESSIGVGTTVRIVLPIQKTIQGNGDSE